jgi:hypothetical protein
MSKMSLAPLVLLWLAAFVFAQSPSVCSPLLPVNVLLNDQPIRDLSAGAFRVRAKHQDIDIQKANYLVAPRRVVLVLSLSGMGERQRELASKAAQAFLSATSAQVPLALVSVSGAGIESTGFDQGRSRIGERLETFRASTAGKGRSTIYDGILAAVQLLRPPKTGDSIYLITNGRISIGKATVSDVREALVDSRIRLFTLLLLDSYYFEGPSEMSEILDLARDSGGTAFTDMVSDRLPAEEESVSQNLKRLAATFAVLATGFYAVELESKMELAGRTHVEVEMLDSKGKPRHDVSVSYPNLISCASSP